MVRLRQGDFARETAYEATRSRSRARFVGAGRDLAPRRRPRRRAGRGAAPAGARRRRSWPRRTGAARVELGGGLRTAIAVAGRARRRVRRGWPSARRRCATPRSPRELVARHGPARIVGVDRRPRRPRAGRGLARGRRRACPAADAIVACSRTPASTTFEVTAIERDGLLEGPTSTSCGRSSASSRAGSSPRAASPRSTTCSRSRRSGCAGAIVGSALYEGRFDVGAAMAAVGNAGRRYRLSEAPAHAGQCPSACSFLCASMILSARCDGTSS